MNSSIELVREAMKIEAAGLQRTIELVDERYLPVIDAILHMKGKLVFMGVGKSGHIGKKLAASFSSLGIPAIFVHSTEALHGDLGMILKEDVVIMLSNSGTTHEVLASIPNLNEIGCLKVAFTSEKESKLAEVCDLLLDYSYTIEADQYNLAPTTSALVMLSLGDSIAVTVSRLNHFTEQGFHLYHPGGALGSGLKDKLK